MSEPFTREDGEALLAACEAADRRRAEQIPDQAAALNHMFDGWLRLKELGWCEAIYCPKDGSVFEVIGAGSTGIHDCVYEGAWPNGRFWILDAGDMWPSRPILFRLKQEKKL